jgi:hypothetical protein
VPFSLSFIIAAPPGPLPNGTPLRDHPWEQSPRAKAQTADVVPLRDGLLRPLAKG